jgi:hypothetical protein
VTLTPLAAELRLHPGQPLPTVHGARPMLAPALAQGRRAAELPALLAGLFSLCAHAHRLTAQRAVAAARGEAADTPLAERQALQAATAREHLLRIAHDWPRQLAGDASARPIAELRGCPLWHETAPLAERLDGLRNWLAAHWLVGPAEAWLARQAADPRWALAWCEAQRHRSPIAALLWTHRHDAIAARAPARPLALLDTPAATLPLLAERIATAPQFCTRPDWHGEPAETGPWTRALERPAPLPDNAWMRLIARLVDLLQLAQPTGARRLAHGVLELGQHAAIAWTEMARGLLVHRVQLDAAGERVLDCRVLAPTEWNFHPRGVLANALVPLRGPRAAAQARCLAAAFDPCVPFSVAATEEPACTS